MIEILKDYQGLIALTFVAVVLIPFNHFQLRKWKKEHTQQRQQRGALTNPEA